MDKLMQIRNKYTPKKFEPPNLPSVVVTDEEDAILFLLYDNDRLRARLKPIEEEHEQILLCKSEVAIRNRWWNMWKAITKACEEEQ